MARSAVGLLMEHAFRSQYCAVGHNTCSPLTAVQQSTVQLATLNYAVLLVICAQVLLSLP
jgi:hypothetical protein